MTAPLFEVKKLSIAFGEGRRRVPVLTDLSLSLDPGGRLALLGESGSGKTLTARALAGLLPEEARLTGRIAWPALGRAPVPGRDIGFVFQDPMSSLNPVLTIGEQIGEVLETHRGASRRAARDRAAELLATVDMPDPDGRIDAYPHELSGGQRQRVAIACAVAAGPRLLIADEPTTALDTVVQAGIVRLIDRLAARTGMALLLITHDLALASGLAHEAAILYAGRLVEVAPMAHLVTEPRHPYSRGLVAASLDFEHGRRPPLPEIPGSLPPPAERGDGCPFAPRCPSARAACLPRFPVWTGAPRDGVACVLFEPAEAAA